MITAGGSGARGGSDSAAGGDAVRPHQVAVIGAGGAAPDSEAWKLAEAVGRGLAGADVVVVCGGRGGVMEAACRGAVAAGGETIGILPGHELAEANPFCTRVIATGIGHARNLAVVASGEAVIAIGGEWGTLSEIGHARAIGRTVVGLRTWTLSGREAMANAPGIELADTPEAAVAAALAAFPT